MLLSPGCVVPKYSFVLTRSVSRWQRHYEVSLAAAIARKFDGLEADEKMVISRS